MLYLQFLQVSTEPDVECVVTDSNPVNGIVKLVHHSQHG